MTKQDLARELAQKAGITVYQATIDIEALMGIMSNTFIEGKSIYLRGFGTFKVTKQKAKKARNINTGETVMIPERTTVKFVPTKAIKEAMN